MTRLLVFDSGVGGLSVVAEIRREQPRRGDRLCRRRRRLPLWRLGGRGADRSRRRADRGADRAHRPDAVVIACNTASTLVLPPLRARFDLPFVGTVPAIKPAAEQTRSGMVSVLGTYGTIRRDYTRGLIDQFAKECHVRLVGSGESRASRRAAHARRGGGRCGDPRRDRAGLRRARWATDGHGGARLHALPVPACRSSSGCAPWPVTWIDPAPAIARRVAAVLSEGVAPAPSRRRREADVLRGSSGRPGLPLAARFGRSASIRRLARASGDESGRTGASGASDLRRGDEGLGDHRLPLLRGPGRADRADAQDAGRGAEVDIGTPLPACPQLLHAPPGTGGTAARHLCRLAAPRHAWRARRRYAVRASRPRRHPCALGALRRLSRDGVARHAVLRAQGGRARDRARSRGADRAAGAQDEPRRGHCRRRVRRHLRPRRAVPGHRHRCGCVRICRHPRVAASARAVSRQRRRRR